MALEASTWIQEKGLSDLHVFEDEGLITPDSDTRRKKVNMVKEPKFQPDQMGYWELPCSNSIQTDASTGGIRNRPTPSPA